MFGKRHSGDVKLTRSKRMRPRSQAKNWKKSAGHLRSRLTMIATTCRWLKRMEK